MEETYDRCDNGQSGDELSEPEVEMNENSDLNEWYNKEIDMQNIENDDSEDDTVSNINNILSNPNTKKGFLYLAYVKRRVRKKHKSAKKMAKQAKPYLKFLNGQLRDLFTKKPVEDIPRFRSH